MNRYFSVTIAILWVATVSCTTSSKPNESVDSTEVYNEKVNVTPIELEPGKVTFASISDAVQAIPGLRTPQVLPEGAELSSVEWIYPPRMIVQKTDSGKTTIAKDYNISPTLDHGTVVFTYRLPTGTLVVNQGQRPADSTGLGHVRERRLPSGRLVHVYQSESGVKVVRWLVDEKHEFVVASTTADISAMINIIDTLP